MGREYVALIKADRTFKQKACKELSSISERAWIAK
jgi:hypothetical protein